jgi:hypothetical protein
MWRGVTMAKPIRTGSSFVGLGTHRHRMVIYPISHPDPQTGLAMINWIAEITLDASQGWRETGWFRQAEIKDFIHHFEGWTYDWVDHGASEAALAAYDERLCGPISQVILRNRGAGPFGLLNMVDERCGGVFDKIDDVISAKERAEFMAGYKAAAGFAIETLNKAPRTIAEGARAKIAQPA